MGRGRLAAPAAGDWDLLKVRPQAQALPELFGNDVLSVQARGRRWLLGRALIGGLRLGSRSETPLCAGQVKKGPVLGATRPMKSCPGPACPLRCGLGVAEALLKLPLSKNLAALGICCRGRRIRRC